MPWVCRRRLSPNSGFWLSKSSAKSSRILTIELDTSVPKRNLPCIFQIFLPPTERLALLMNTGEAWTSSLLKWRWNFALACSVPVHCARWSGMRALLSSEPTESSSKWQFKHYTFSCSNWIIWLGKMGHIILVILLPSLCQSGCTALGPADPSSSRVYFCFSFWPQGLCSPFT